MYISRLKYSMTPVLWILLCCGKMIILLYAMEDNSRCCFPQTCREDSKHFSLLKWVRTRSELVYITVVLDQTSPAATRPGCRSCPVAFCYTVTVSAPLPGRRYEWTASLGVACLYPRAFSLKLYERRTLSISCEQLRGIQRYWFYPWKGYPARLCYQWNSLALW